MNLRPALLTAAALAAIGTALALGRWGAQGNRELAGLLREFQRGEELPPSLEACRRHVEAQWALAAEVGAGRMSVREAAGHFRRLNEADPGRLPGAPRPSLDEQVLCVRVLDFTWEYLAQRKLFAAAARCYAEAFAAHPQLLRGPPTGHRYWAACAAARAGCGRCRDAAELDEQSGAVFRRQALGWLQAELESRRRLLEQEPGKTDWLAVGHPQRWLDDADLAGVREPDSLSRLPKAERQAWQKLWADVADTLARAEGFPPPEQEAASKIALPDSRYTECR
jgi:hypothetical protein